MSENSAHPLLNSAVDHHRAGRLQQAEEIYRAILRENPGDANALHLLGLVLHKSGRLVEAAHLVTRAAERVPDNSAVQYNLAEINRTLNRLRSAEIGFRRSLAILPNQPEAFSKIGLVHYGRGDFAGAVGFLQNAISLQPHIASYSNDLGLALARQKRFSEAMAAFTRALHLDPEMAEAHLNRGNIWKEYGRLDDAIANFRQALILNPQYAEAVSNLASGLKDRGEVVEALAVIRAALKVAPRRLDIHSNSIMFRCYLPDDRTGDHVDAMREWNRQYSHADRSVPAVLSNLRDADRKLKIGYVSGDFRRHSVSYFLVPLLEAHDRNRFHITCYTANSRADEVTARIRTASDVWRNLVGESNDAAVQLIRDDRIDVLIDLSGHSGGNRLPVFAARSAPLQISHLGYPGTTGVNAIDGRISDHYADPPSNSVGLYPDRVLLLAETAWCYSPLREGPAVAPAPCLATGAINFGCFNNFSKINPETVLMWCEILRALPSSRLLLKNQAVQSPIAVARMQQILKSAGLSVDRLEFLPWDATWEEHMRSYHRIDIALDTFPYNGTTTTCEALWMGVPTISLAGDSHRSRVGRSLLSNVGLPQFVASSPTGLIETAQRTATDIRALSETRARLRERMRASPLMDAHRYARHFENAIRQEWRSWCLR